MIQNADYNKKLGPVKFSYFYMAMKIAAPEGKGTAEEYMYIAIE